MIAIQRPEFFFNVMIYAMGQSLTPPNGWGLKIICPTRIILNKMHDTRSEF